MMIKKMSATFPYRRLLENDNITITEETIKTIQQTQNIFPIILGLSLLIMAIIMIMYIFKKTKN